MFWKPGRTTRRGAKVSPREALYFASMPQLLSVLTPARWNLLEVLKASGPLSIYALAKALERNYSNVHSDVTKLRALGVDRQKRQGKRVCTFGMKFMPTFSLKAAA